MFKIVIVKNERKLIGNNIWYFFLCIYYVFVYVLNVLYVRLYNSCIIFYKFLVVSMQVKNLFKFECLLGGCNGGVLLKGN